MAHNEELAKRLRAALGGRKNLAEIKMFGGLCFTLGGNMCCGILKDDLVLRVDKVDYLTWVRESHARPMNFTGREMKGFLYVAPEGWRGPGLTKWLRRAVSFAESLPPKRRRASGKSSARH